MLSLRSIAARTASQRLPTAARQQRWVPVCRSFATTADSTAATPTVNAVPVAAVKSSPSPRPSVKEASSESAQRSFALRLYKALLRAHRTMLPDAMRSLGDAYVREEFKLHKSAKPQHLHGFFTQWIQYLDQMRTQSPGQWGQPMTPALLESMSAEQKQQLELLQKSAARLDAQWTGMEKDQNPITQTDK